MMMAKEIYVVGIHNQYMVAMAYEERRVLRTSPSIYDAARISDLKKATHLARRVRGKVIAFNPITGGHRELSAG